MTSPSHGEARRFKSGRVHHTYPTFRTLSVFNFLLFPKETDRVSSHGRIHEKTYSAYKVTESVENVLPKRVYEKKNGRPPACAEEREISVCRLSSR